MAEDVNWAIALICAPTVALISTVPIHPRFMVFPSNGHYITPMTVAPLNIYNFYAPYGKNKLIYPIVTWIHWVFVFVALGLPPIWIIVKLGYEIKCSTVLYWLFVSGSIISLISPYYLGPSWRERKSGFEKEKNRRILNQDKNILPVLHKNRYD